MFTPKNIFNFLKDIKKGISILDKLNEKHHFDIVYSNTLAVLLGMIYAKKRKIKHLWHVHEIIVSPKNIASVFPKLLMQNANVTEACYDTGFESLSYFNKIFKKITGENPSAFRKRKGLD